MPEVKISSEDVFDYVKELLDEEGLSENIKVSTLLDLLSNRIEEETED